MASGKGISDTHLFGEGVESGKETPVRVISLTEFENSIKLASSGSIAITTPTVTAYVSTFTPNPGKAVVQVAILKAKSWAPKVIAYDPGFIPSLSDFSASIKAYSIGLSDFSAEIVPTAVPTSLYFDNLPAYLQPHHLRSLPAVLQPLSIQDIPGIVFGIGGVNLSSLVVPIVPADITGTAFSVPSINLYATGGAHPPGNITAALSAVLPVNLPVYIRAGFSGTTDVPASIIQKGQVQDLGVFLRLAQTAVKELSSHIGVIGRSSGDITAALQPYRSVNLIATITTQRIRDMRAIVAGIYPTHSDMSASVARIDSASFDVGAYTIAQFIDLTDVAGKLRAVQLGGTDVPSSLTSVFPFYNINRVIVHYIPLTNLPGVVIQAGALLGIRGSITPVQEQHTGENASTGFVTTATSYRFYLGTNRGVFRPTDVIKEVRIETFSNTYDSPDLHATISGWNLNNLSASLSVYPYTEISAHINGLGLDRVSDISASLATFNVRNMQATVTPFGSTTDVLASVDSAGLINDITAIVVPTIDVLSLKIIPVTTQPISDMAALINYDNFVKCSPTSQVVGLLANIRPLMHGTPNNIVNMAASVTSNAGTSSVSADICIRRVTKINVLNLTFTLKDRGASFLPTILIPTARETTDIFASVVGLSHVQDIPATLDVVRYELHDVDFTLTEQLVNLKTGNVKDVLVTFKSQVQQYIYESVTGAVYSTDRGTWAIDLRTLITDESLFDRSLGNRDMALTSLSEYASLDEAIRAGIVALCERRQDNFTATIQAAGKVDDMSATCFAYSLDKVSDLKSKIMPVESVPDIAAQINMGITSSDLLALHAVITPNYSEVLSNLSGNIFGDIRGDISASITAT